MTSRQAPTDTRPTPVHFELTVWPQTPSQRWRAEVCVDAGSAPQRFDLPVDLLRYLTQLPGSVPGRTGLR